MSVRGRSPQGRRAGTARQNLRDMRDIPSPWAGGGGWASGRVSGEGRWAPVWVQRGGSRRCVKKLVQQVGCLPHTPPPTPEGIFFVFLSLENFVGTPSVSPLGNVKRKGRVRSGASRSLEPCGCCDLCFSSDLLLFGSLPKISRTYIAASIKINGSFQVFHD